MYRVYIEDQVIVFTPQASTAENTSRLYVAPGEELTLTKLLQKVQFTKRLEVISDQIDRVFDEFSQTLPLIEAGGGLVLDEQERVLMIFRNGRWDLPKGKREKNEPIRECAVREVSEECSVGDLTIERPLTDTYHTYRIDGHWVLKRTSWFLMHCPGAQRPTPQTIEGITEATWIPEAEVPSKVAGTYRTIRDVFAAWGHYGDAAWLRD